MNSPTILVKVCPECNQEFQTYQIDKDFCSPSCSATHSHKNHQDFLRGRKNPKLCRKPISCNNCRHLHKNCKGREIKVKESTHLTPNIRNW